ncbi:hypothetical protein FACS1894198_2450 [Clostridia bacterium]|nr:hypothetical protein FACS1894198_2450 [Clostridia bacterium]
MSNEKIFEAVNLKNPNEIIKSKIRAEMENYKYEECYNDETNKHVPYHQGFFDEDFKIAIRMYEKNKKENNLRLFLGSNGSLYLVTPLPLHWMHASVIIKLL